MRVVLDTNVLVSSLITKGKPAELLQRLLGKKVDLVISKTILDEFVDVIGRPKFHGYVGDKQIKDFLGLLLGVALFIDVKSHFDVTQDKADNMILATAYDANADYIVSGDKRLLRLKKFRRIKIVSVNEMLQLLKARYRRMRMPARRGTQVASG